MPSYFPCLSNCVLSLTTVSDMLFNANSAIFQLYHGENKLIFNMFCGIFIVLAHWNKSPRKDTSLYSDTLSWFRTNQFLLFLLIAACLAKKQQIPILSLVWFDRGSNRQSTTLEAGMLTITPPMRFFDNRPNIIYWTVMI